MKRKAWTVLELSIKMKVDWENLDRRHLVKIKTLTGQWQKVGMFGGKIIGVLVVTTETASELMNRVRPTLDTMEIIDDFWCRTAGRDLTGKFGDLCPYRTRMTEAWAEVGKRNQTKNMAPVGSKDIFLKHGVDFFKRQDSVKMGLNPQRKR